MAEHIGFKNLKRTRKGIPSSSTLSITKKYKQKYDFESCCFNPHMRKDLCNFSPAKRCSRSQIKVKFMNHKKTNTKFYQKQLHTQ